MNKAPPGGLGLHIDLEWERFLGIFRTAIWIRLSLFHVMSLEVVMFGTDFPMFATSHFKLYAASTNMLVGIA